MPLVGLLVSVFLAGIAAEVRADSKSKICDAYRANYDWEQAGIDRMRNEPYRSNKQARLDEKWARLEEQCGTPETIAGEDGLQEVEPTSELAGQPDSGERPQLTGEVEMTVLDGSVSAAGGDDSNLPVLRSRTPIPDPRAAPAANTGTDGSFECRGTYTECYGQPQPPLPGYSAGAPDGSKRVTRVPGSAGGRNPDPAAPVQASREAAIGQCLRPHFPDYTNPAWGPLESVASQNGSAMSLEQAFPIVQLAARQALEIEKRRYGNLPYGDNSYAYLEGWLGRCLWDAGTISKREDPRAPYKRFLTSQRLSDDLLEERYHDWDVGFRSTYSPWPWHVIRARQVPAE